MNWMTLKTIEDVRQAAGGVPCPAGRERLEVHAESARRLWATKNTTGGWVTVVAFGNEFGEGGLLLWCLGWLGELHRGDTWRDMASYIEQYLSAHLDNPAVIQELRYYWGIDTWKPPVPPAPPLEFERNEALYAAYDPEVGF